MTDLYKLFLDIQENKDSYLQCSKGKEFEDRLDTYLHGIGYSRIKKEDVENFTHIKKDVLLKDREEDVSNTTKYKKHYIIQPCGTQNYPDFMVFDEDRIISIEVKYSRKKQKKPVWNSGLPRPNGVYIFGSFGCRDITFFKGSDVLTLDEIRKLHQFFEEAKKSERAFNKSEMQNQTYGFKAYIRKAFDQSKTPNREAIPDYFNNPNRQSLENKVLSYVKGQGV